jgi:hypothetical protein
VFAVKVFPLVAAFKTLVAASRVIEPLAPAELIAPPVLTLPVVDSI